jgi:hypothetical protein
MKHRAEFFSYSTAKTEPIAQSDRLLFRFVHGDALTNDLVEAKIVELNLRHYRQDKIATAIHKSKPRVSRSIRYFPETGLIPDALPVGRSSKVTSELASYIEARTNQEPSISGESLSGTSPTSSAFQYRERLLTQSGSGRALNVS